MISTSFFSYFGLRKRHMEAGLPPSAPNWAPNIAWEPMDLPMDSSIRLSLTIQGNPATGLLDSGSTVTAISATFAERHEIQASKQVKAAALNKIVEVGIVSRVSLEFGGATKALTNVAVADLSHFSDALGRPIDVLLGQDFLRLSPVLLDFSSRRIAFVSSLTEIRGGDWHSVPLSVTTSGELVVAAKIGLSPVQLLFDIGNVSPLLLSQQVAASEQALRTCRHSTALMGTIAGTQAVTTLSVPVITFGTIDVAGVPSSMMTNWVLPNCVGSFGLPLIGQFDVYLDLAAKRLLVKRASQPLPLHKDRSGLGLAFAGSGLRIVHVASGSPAADARFLVGEVIIAVNDVPIDLSYLTSGRWRWRYEPAGTKIKLTDNRSRERMIALRDYF